jgi:dienelactone hydrolase
LACFIFNIKREEDIMKKIILALLLFLFSAVPAMGEIIGKEVLYNAGNLTMQGYLAYDDSISGKRPGVLVVHEWWGHNEYSRNRATMLAKLGYTALAVDMYGDGKQAAHPDEAGKFAAEVRQNLPAAKQRLAAATRVLQKHPTVDPEHIAAIGYCFGGGVLLEMARQGFDMDAVVIFHGSLATTNPAAPGVIKTRILVCNGADDKFVPHEQIQAFHREMQAADVDFTFISYPGAKHSFTNPGANIYAEKFNLPVGYNKEADKKSWKDMQDFLQDTYAK